MQREAYPPSPAAAVYCRVSTREQADDGNGLAAQERTCRARAAADGFNVPDEFVYVDAGISGASADRPEYQRMLAAADAGRLVALYVWKFDRLGRDTEEMLRAWGVLEKAKVRLISVTEGEDAKLIYTIRAAVAEEEKEKIRQRTREGLREVALSGRAPGGQPPLGYRAEGIKKERRFVPEPSEIHTVQRIFALYSEGKGINTICKTLNGSGHRTRKGRMFSPRVVLDMISNPVFVGHTSYKGEIVALHTHEPIIEPDTWETAQALRKARHAPRSEARGRPPRRHLLGGGLLRCRCGRAMSAKRNRNGYEHYRCSRRITYGDCDMPSMGRAAVDEAVFAYFAGMVLDPAATRQALAEASERAVREARALSDNAEREKARVEAELDLIENDYLSGGLKAASYERLHAKEMEEWEAATAQAGLLHDRNIAAMEFAETANTATEMVERLAAIRAAVAGKVKSPEGIEAVRAALQGVFTGFEIHERASDDWAPTLDALGLRVGGQVLVPLVRPEALLGVEPDGSHLTNVPRVPLLVEGDPSAPWLPGRPCPGGRRSRRQALPAGGALRPPPFWPRFQRAHG